MDERGRFAFAVAPDEETILNGSDARPRLERELRRLEALAGRRRLRVRLLRALRGTLGAGATLATLLKLKLAGSLGLKLLLAGLVGLGLAWPIAALGVLALAGIVLSLVSLFSGESGPHGLDCDCPSECGRKEERAARLKQSIARREAWLANPSGPAPSVRRDAPGRRRIAAQRGRRGR